ncbi:MAG: choice-of-anchor D domain-containing protein [Gammaproteobacteria bacterium]
MDTNSTENGMTQIYSATFDGAMAPCSTPGLPTYCSFFNGFPPPSPPATRAIVFTPNPSRVISGVPDGIGPGLPPISPPQPVPPAGSFLDMTLAPGNTSVTLAGGTIKFPDIPIVIQNSTVINARGAGVAFNPAPQTVPVDANGVAEFRVNLAPAIAVDFSAFTVVATDCSGPLCALVQVLTLDMIKYRLLIDYNATFTAFTASFIGQTGNNSFVFATLNSANVILTDSVLPAEDLLVPFGLVPQGETATQTVTVTNSGTGSLQVGQIATANPLAAPYSVVSDNCSTQDLAPAASCTFGIQFAPIASGVVNDSLDIPTSDPDKPTVTFNVSGNSSSVQVPDITITDADTPTNDQRMSFRTVLVSDSSELTITVANDGAGDLVIGTVAQANPLAAPFDFVADTCTGQTIAPAGTCTITVSFTPGAIEASSDSFDIPSNDPDEASVTFSLSGSGGGTVEPPSASGASSGFMAVDPLTLLALGLLGLAVRRKSPIG